QIYQGLYKFDQRTLEPIFCIAESENVSDDQKTWTIKIKKGVKFQDDECFSGGKGREVTAKDVKYCLDLICSKYPENTNFQLLTDAIVGARDYYDGKATEVSGIKLVDNYTIEFSLNHPFSDF